MEKRFLRFFLFFISVILICSFLIINGCARNGSGAASDSSQASAESEPDKIPTETESLLLESQAEITEESISTTENLLSEEEVLAETKNMLTREVQPLIFLAFLNDNITALSLENANTAFDDLEKLLKIYEVKYTDKLLSGKDGNYQIQLNDFVLENPGEKVGELTKDQVLAIPDSDLKNLLFEIFDSGYKLINLEGSWYPIIDYSRYEVFIDYLSDDYGAYILFRALESNQIFAKDAALQITWDELASRVLAIEDFLLKYPASNKYVEMGNSYYNYLMFYYIGMDNTPAFDYDTNKFKDEVLASYNKMISGPENNRFFTVELISKYLDVIAQNNNTINENVRKYIRDSYLRVENKYGILNPYTGT